MKVLFDTNVIIDIFTLHDRDYYNSRNLLKYILNGSIDAYICIKQISDIYYIFRKYFQDESKRREALEMILETFKIVQVTKGDYLYCLKSDFEDLEDCLIDEVSSVNMIKAIVTNDKTGFFHAKSTIFTPKDLLTIMEATD